MTDLSTFLDTSGTHLTSEIAVWFWEQTEIHLEISYYVIKVLPDSRHITSVRGIVLRDSKILVVKNNDEVQHIIPGGRLEHGETLLETLTREIIEETGWTIVQPQLFGVMYHHHLTPCPKEYPYPYPEFLQIVYLVQADKVNVEMKQNDDYEKEAQFLTFDDALKLPIANGQKAYLRQLQN